MNKQLARNFLNKELADLAKARGDVVNSTQATVVMSDAAKVRIRELVKYAPSR